MMGPVFTPPVQEGCCSRSWRRVVPEAGASRPSQIPQRQPIRVNGWSKPIHALQVVAWVLFLVLAFSSFSIFIPFLPRDWKYVAYGVTGALFFFHFIVLLIATSLDPAEASIRLKNYPEPLPIFDSSKHVHVIENQYCHLCRVPVSKKAKHCSTCNKCISGFDHHCKWLNNCVGTRNYWFFFGSVASALAGLLCLLVILLYVFIQYCTNPEELRTDPHYRGISEKNTWLLFLPLLPVKTKTPVVLGIGVFVLLLDIFCLLMLGQLLIFHLYLRSRRLSTFDYMMQHRLQETSKTSEGEKGSSTQIEMPQHAGEGLSSSAQGKEKWKQFPRLSWSPSLCSINTIHPEKSSSLEQTVVDLSSSAQGLKSKEFLPPAVDPSQSFVVTVYPVDSLSLLKGARGNQRPPGFGDLPRPHPAQKSALAAAVLARALWWAFAMTMKVILLTEQSDGQAGDGDWEA
ncbi:probable palmitoyltransferase ZDHHC11B [Diceros bicornis minor]|uniref:probable palmitoyltransferase ZDHHC11B n=1 Tax=Diceros bicornis minor TaxID=77932 RepID=UPI0026EE5B20|nr:probable palmitoyltransferase ZDHHC11B [Diceros bicornis minor]